MQLAKQFSFDLFRLNIVDFEDLFQRLDNQVLRGDNEIVALLEKAANSSFDEQQQTRTAVFKWSIRDFNNYSDLSNNRPLLSLTLARSLLEKDGLIVTDEGVSSGTSYSSPAPASAVICLFDLTRHLVAVEHSSDLYRTAWKDFIEKILENAALSMQRASSIKLEPVPEQYGITRLFKSFDRITRMRLTLRIPNPELTRYTKSLYDDLVAADIREITQDMKNPNGLSKSEEARPYASAVIAEQGYKSGEVHFEGTIDDNFESVSSGSKSARGKISGLKDYIRGMSATAKTKETKSALAAITKEIDKIHPLVSENE